MILLIIQSLFFSALGFDCQLNTYETSILNENNPFLRENRKINLNYYWQQADSYGFAIWTKYIPYSSMNLPIDQVGQPIDLSKRVDGRLIFTIRPTNQENFILAYYQSLPLAYPNLNHTIVYVSNSQAKSHNINYFTRDYQGYWEFTYLSFMPNYQVIELVYGNLEKYGVSYISPFKYIDYQDYEITLGGQGKIQMTSSISYNLQAFPGRISKLIYLNSSAFIYNGQQFSQTFTAACKVPNKFQQKQVVYLFEDVVKFDGTKQFYKEHKQEGQDYSISLWVKPNFENFTQSDNMILFRAYINKDYRDKQYLGDRSFFVYYYVDMLTNWTTLHLTTYAFKTPEKNATDGQKNYELRYWMPQITTDALQSWHFISFIYGQSFYRIRGEIFIPKFQQNYEQIYGTYDISNQFTDTMMYFQLAVDRYFFSQRFQGEIAQMKFTTFINDNNYKNYPCNFHIQVECHYTCEQTKDCTGPTKYDCKSCIPESNRVYIAQLNQCQCKFGYVELDKEIQCQKFTDYYPSLSLYSESQRSTVQFRQFKFNNFYLDCPQSYNKLEIRCLECLTNIFEWQFNPICQSDLQKYNGQDNEPYKKTLRKDEEIELYYITEQGYVMLCQGCLKYCKVDEDLCNLSSYFHNGVQMGVICKQQQYFNKDGYCQPCLENCNKCSSFGICLQCNEGFYYDPLYNKCVFCGSDCKTCIYSNEYQNFECISCPQNTSLFEGRCYQCGFLCGFCEFEFNIITKQYFNRCLRCLLPKEQFLSFDGINCFKGNILDCLYGFQYKKTNRQINTLDYKFQPQTLDDSIITGCAKCNVGLVYTIADNTCSSFVKGILGEYFIRETDQQKTQYDIICLQCSQNNYNFFKTTVVQTDLCYILLNPLSQCRMCIQSKTYNILQCNLCNSGYYSSRLESICIPCQLNCWMCSEQQINTQDLYKIDLKPLYEYFVNYDGNHDFREYGQSKDQNDYEVVCTVCRVNYELVNNRCVPKCPDNCQSCEIVDGLIQCLQCYSTQQGVMLILWENQCIECPNNCNVCVPQSQQSIKSINPYFESTNYHYYSHFCLKKFEQIENLFWDQDLYKFIECSDGECLQSLIINLNILCSDQEYDLNYNSIFNLDEKSRYLQQNVKLSQLFSPNVLSNLPQFENDLIYKYVNQIGMKRIVIIFYISNDQSEQCILPLNARFQQIFSTNIFSAIDVQLQIQGNQTEIIIQNSMIFSAFTVVNITGITFTLQNNNLSKYFIVASLISCKVKLNDVHFVSYITDEFQISFYNSSAIHLIQVSLTNLTIENQDRFIDIQYQDSINQRDLIIEGIYLQNCKIINSNFIKLTNITNIYLKDIYIISFFNNSQLFTFQAIQVIVESIGVNKSNIYNSVLFALNDANSVTINQVTIANSLIYDSILFYFAQSAQMSYVQIYNNDIQLRSQLILVKQIIETLFLFKFQQFQVNNNQYSDTCYIIYYLISQVNSNLTMLDFTIIYNNLKQSDKYQLDTFNNSMIMIRNVSSVYLANLLIQRGHTVPELTIYSSNYIYFKNIQVTLDFKVQRLGLHQYLDCLALKENFQGFPTIIYIFNSLQIVFENIQFEDNIQYNQAFIKIISDNVNNAGIGQKIELLNSRFTNNLLIKTTSNSQISILLIKSSIQQEIKLENVTFSRNYLNQYIQNSILESSCLMLINCLTCNINFNNIKAEYNIVTNSTSTLLNIITNTLTMINSTFLSNNIFNFQIIRQHIYWGFDASQQIYLENLKQIFPINSESGCCQLVTKNILIDTLIIQNQQGSKGSGLNLEIVDQGSIIIQNSKFNNVSSLVHRQSIGGCLHFDCSQSGCSITLMNTEFNQVYSNSKGGIIYLVQTQFNQSLQIIGLKGQNYYATTGSFIYASFLSTKNQNEIYIQNVTLYNDQPSLIQYCAQIYNYNLQQYQKSNLINKLSIIYLENIKLLIDNFSIKKSYQEIVLIILNTQQLQILNLYLLNITLSTNYIMLIEPNSINSRIIFQNLQIVDFIDKIQNYKSCDAQINGYFVQQMMCNSNKFILPNVPIDLPQIITPVTLEQVGKCRFYQMLEQQPQNISFLMAIANIYESNQIEFENIKITNVKCQKCLEGLIKIQLIDQNAQIRIKSLYIFNNICGLLGGLMIIQDSYQQISNRFLTENEKSKIDLNIKIKISNYHCSYNNATYGTCLYLKNVQVFLVDSLLQHNYAEQTGGGIYLDTESTEISLLRTFIINNQALLADNIYTFSGQIENVTYSESIILKKIKTDGPVIIQQPSKLSLGLISSQPFFNTKTLFCNDSMKIDTINLEGYIIKFRYQDQHSQVVENIMQPSYIYLPNGQPISKYQVYSQILDSYIDPQFSLKLFALDETNQIQTQLNTTFCTIEGQIVYEDSSIVDNTFTSNFTNLQKINYSPISGFYDLNDLIIYYSPTTDNEYLLLQFKCNSIAIPLFNQTPPYNIIGYNTNYYLRINVTTFPCQMGEINNLSQQSCQLCDSTQDQYSVIVNSTKCEIRNEQTTTSVTPAQLQLKNQYWRPYIQCSLISYCQNNPLNCLGGWKAGDTSCFEGHIGALCEQCDIYNIRGSGNFAVSSQYLCGPCQSVGQNILIISLVSLWTFFTIWITVNYQVKFVNQIRSLPKFIIIALKIANEDGKSGVLIKILTNYLQIIGALTSLQLQIPQVANNILSTAANPIQTMVYSLDCFLISITSIPILYARVIWLVSLPIIYILISVGFYILWLALKKQPFKLDIISTILLYIFIFQHPNIVRNLISLVSYRTISGYKWVQGHTAYRYDTNDHFIWSIQFLLLLILIGLIVPILIIIRLNQINKQKKLNSVKIRERYGYLYNEYKHSAYFWEIIKILMKLVIIFIVIYFEDFIILKSLLITLALQIYLKVQTIYLPYLLDIFNQLDQFQTFSCQISYTLGCVLFTAQQQSIQYIQLPIILCICIVNFLYLSKQFRLIIIAYIDKYQNWFDQIKEKIKQHFPSIIQKFPSLAHNLQNKSMKKSEIRNKFKSIFKMISKDVKNIKIKHNQELNLQTNRDFAKSKLISQPGE